MGSWLRTAVSERAIGSAGIGRPWQLRAYTRVAPWPGARKGGEHASSFLAPIAYAWRWDMRNRHLTMSGPAPRIDTPLPWRAAGDAGGPSLLLVALLPGRARR